MESYLMGVDLGTTNVKAMIFDLEGNPLSKGEAGHYPILSARMNWAEQDARVWWQDTADAIRQAVGRLPGDPRGIAAVSVSSQGMAMLPLDEFGEPLCNAHIWMDRRGVEEARFIEQAFGRERVKERFGAYADPYYQIANILWFKNHQPELFQRTRHIVKANTYLNYKLTGRFALDEGQACMTLCYDIVTRQWSDELADAIKVPLKELLPPVRAASEVLGEVTGEAARETGLPAGTPVMVSGVDSALALLEVGITRQGDAAEITGTSSNNFFASKRLPPKESPLLWFVPLVKTEAVPEMIFAPTNATGEALSWFRRVTGLTGTTGPDGRPVYEYLEGLASSAAAGSGGLIFYPYLMGERAPLWDSNMRGMYIGANVATTQADMLRAVYEGTSFALKEICEEVKKTGVTIRRFRVAGGCAGSDVWLKIKASALNMPIEATTNSGGAPKGNAILAGYGVGIYKDFPATVERMVSFNKYVEPDPEWARRYEDLFPLFLRMRGHLKEDLDKLAEVSRRHTLH
jgi:xylulokinase